MNVLFSLVGGRKPERQTEGSAGYDLYSVVEMLLPAKSVGLVKLGFKMQFDVGYEAQIRSRSGLALKHQVVVLNAPGTIDADYRDEVGVILMNLSNDAFHIRIGDRVAQMVFAKIERPDFKVVDSLEESYRCGGFGSTGV